MTLNSKIELYQKLECSLILIDLSGFTQLLYHASYKDEIMRDVLMAVKKLFQNATKAALLTRDIQIVNTTGDGFVAIATGATPTRTAVKYIQEIKTHFKQYVKSVISSVPFRQRLDLRIALHHGFVYKIHISGLAKERYPLFIGDDLNLLSRLINSQVARRYGVALTKAFYKRLMLTSDKELSTSDEAILDLNRYPEQIEVYRLPAKFPGYIPKRKKHPVD
jgi:hypothetical protein